MKLMINYDLIKEICNVNSPYGPTKIIRNNQKNWTMFHFPIWMTANLVIHQNIPISLGILGAQFGLVMGCELVANKITGTDIYANRSSNNLKRLVPQLNDLNVFTSYDLLLQSELYKRKYKIKLNKSKLPSLIESKYILVPSYAYNGDIKDVSILQEHEIGSKQYVLSIGSPKKEFKPAYSNI